MGRRWAASKIKISVSGKNYRLTKAAQLTRNGRKVAEYMSLITGKEISSWRGWEYLKQMEYTLKVP